MRGGARGDVQALRRAPSATRCRSTSTTTCWPRGRSGRRAPRGRARRATPCRCRRARRCPRDGRHRPAERTKAANRAAILDAAREAFGELGYEAVGVRDIVRRTELASGTFYNYFPDKDAVFDALIVETAASARRRVRDGARGRARPRGAGRARLPRLLRVGRRGPGPLRLPAPQPPARPRAGVLPAGGASSPRTSRGTRRRRWTSTTCAHAMVTVGRRARRAHGRARAARRGGRDPLRDGAVRPAGGPGASRSRPSPPPTAPRMEIADARPLFTPEGAVPEHRHLRPAAAHRVRGARGRARRVAPRAHAVRRLGRVRRPRARARFARLARRGPRRRRGRRRRSPRSPGSSPPRCPTARGCSRVEGDFTSVLFPFLAQEPRGVTRRAGAARAARGGARRRSTTSSRSPSCRARTGASPTSTRSRRRPPRTTCARSSTRRSRRAGSPLDHGRFDYTACAGYKWLLQPARDGVLHAAARAARRAASRTAPAGTRARRCTTPTTARRCGSRATRGASTSRPPGTAGSARRRRSSCWPSSGAERIGAHDVRDGRTGCATALGLAPGDSAIVSVGGLREDAAERLAGGGRDGGGARRRAAPLLPPLHDGGGRRPRAGGAAQAVEHVRAVAPCAPRSSRRSCPSFSITRREPVLCGSVKATTSGERRAGRTRCSTQAAPSSVASPWPQRVRDDRPGELDLVGAVERRVLDAAAGDELAASRDPATRTSPKPCAAKPALMRAICSSTSSGVATPPSVSPTRGSARSAISPSRCCGPMGSARRRAVVGAATSITGRGRAPRGCRGRGRGCPARRRRRGRSRACGRRASTSMRGDRAVERVVLAAGRVGVDPGDASGRAAR